MSRRDAGEEEELNANEMRIVQKHEEMYERYSKKVAYEVCGTKGEEKNVSGVKEDESGEKVKTV